MRSPVVRRIPIFTLWLAVFILVPAPVAPRSPVESRASFLRVGRPDLIMIHQPATGIRCTSFGRNGAFLQRYCQAKHGCQAHVFGNLS
jgi:hypothetical protein